MFDHEIGETIQPYTGPAGVTLATYFGWRVLRFLTALLGLVDKATGLGKRAGELMEAQVVALKEEKTHREKMEVFFNRLAPPGAPAHMAPDHTPSGPIRVTPQPGDSGH